MELKFASYTEVLMFVQERRNRSFAELQVAMDPPAGSGRKPSKAFIDRLTGEVRGLDLVLDQLMRATYTCDACGSEP